ncbi:carbon-nitrogen hydrolase family protein [Pedobacter sp. SYSU D00535]|uniref:carbon-nitrogen hydrolase family protein n=1 Tax=Pedobacter sp. SYSU D00535 TaxID=2810308 RepID=UPI001A977F32|nr:carbon-nitrogen hydrolase family protein [Pedobacter sp. SYSU D00535]
MKIAIASPPIPKSLEDGLLNLAQLVEVASKEKAEIICFPESYLPGYPGMPCSEEDRNPAKLQAALKQACLIAAKNQIALVLPMDWYHEQKFLNVAFVIDEDGRVLGYQAKNQLDPSEDNIWEAGTARHIFEIKGLKFGIVICHEGFRYPETVRWAARRGAKIVFHPHFAGSDSEGPSLTEWGNKNNPYYEKAMMMRALENTIYFASSNYASRFPESASAIIAPDGTCVVNESYGRAGVIIADINPDLATGLLASRFKSSLYTPDIQ